MRASNTLVASLVAAGALFASTPALAGGLPDDSHEPPFDVASASLGARYFTGHQPGTLTTGSEFEMPRNASVPYSRWIGDLSMELEFPGGPGKGATAYDTPVMAIVAAHFGIVGPDQVDTSGGVTANVRRPNFDISTGIAGGSALVIYGSQTFWWEARVLIDVEYGWPAWYMNTWQLSAWFGSRARLNLGPVRAFAEYAVAPFWLGSDRIEHRITAGVRVHHVGVRGWLSLGQERKPEGGYSETGMGLALELGW